MEDIPNPGHRPGGSVEPVSKVAGAKQLEKAALDPPGRHYQLFDAVRNTLQRAQTFDEMVVKADRVGAVRFQAVDADKTRIDVHKVDGEWVRPGPPRSLPRPSGKDMVDLSARGRKAAGSAQDVSQQPAAAAAGAAAIAADKGERGTGAKLTQGPVQISGSTPAPAAPSPRADLAAERGLRAAEIERALHERYVIKRALLKVGDLQVGTTEYRFRGDQSRLAFTESPSRLATDINSPSVARSMVDVAQTRGWKAIRVTGNEDFKRQVWLEASVRGVNAIGYAPVPGDIEQLRREREARQVNRVEPAGDKAGAAAATPASKQSARGGGGRKAVLSALEAILVDRKVPEKVRQAVMVAAANGLARRQAAGERPAVKIYDKAAPSQRTAAMPTPEVQRVRDRATPAPAR